LSTFQLAETAAKGIKGLFSNDTKGSASLEAVRIISQLVRRKSYNVRPLVIETFLELRLTHSLDEGYDIFDQKTQPGSKKTLTKKERKARREEKKKARELKEQTVAQMMEEKKRIVCLFVHVIFFKLLLLTHPCSKQKY